MSREAVTTHRTSHPLSWGHVLQDSLWEGRPSPSPVPCPALQTEVLL